MPIYVASTALVLAALLRNCRSRACLIVALGRVQQHGRDPANGGYMPADPGGARRRSAGVARDGLLEQLRGRPIPRSRPLTDIFALPRWVPFANVFSVGDVLIGVGVVVAIVVAMKRAAMPPPNPPAATGAQRRPEPGRPVRPRNLPRTQDPNRYLWVDPSGRSRQP